MARCTWIPVGDYGIFCVSEGRKWTQVSFNETRSAQMKNLWYIDKIQKAELSSFVDAYLAAKTALVEALNSERASHG